MSKIIENLLLLMQEENLNELELSRKTNVGQSVINRILSNNTELPRTHTIQKLAEYFGITSSQLLGEEPLPNIRISKNCSINLRQSVVPIINHKKIFEWLHQNEIDARIADQWITADVDLSKNVFAIVMPDASMYPRIPKDAFLIFDPLVQCEDQDIGLIYDKKTQTFLIKEINTDGNRIIFKSENFNIKPMEKTLRHVLVAALVEVKFKLKETPKSQNQAKAKNFNFAHTPFNSNRTK